MPQGKISKREGIPSKKRQSIEAGACFSRLESLRVLPTKEVHETSTGCSENQAARAPACATKKKRILGHGGCKNQGGSKHGFPQSCFEARFLGRMQPSTACCEVQMRRAHQERSKSLVGDGCKIWIRARRAKQKGALRAGLHGIYWQYYEERGRCAAMSRSRPLACME